MKISMITFFKFILTGKSIKSAIKSPNKLIWRNAFSISATIAVLYDRNFNKTPNREVESDGPAWTLGERRAFRFSTGVEKQFWFLLYFDFLL